MLNIEEYLQEQFRPLAQAMWPNGCVWGGYQHRDIVRVFLAGAFVMDQNQSPSLGAVVEEATVESWRPGEQWNWPIAEMN